jgi:hypothetical protein
MQPSDYVASLQPMEFQWADIPKRGRVLLPCDVPVESPYNPFTDSKRSTLFKVLAKLQPTEEAIAAFAKKHGTLRERPQPTLDDWRNEIAKLADAIDLWEAVRADDKKAMRRWIPSDRSGELLVASWQESHCLRGFVPLPNNYAKADVLNPAVDLLLRIINEQVGTVGTKAVRSSTPILARRIVAPDLATVAWLQFEQSITANWQLRDCEVCGTPFIADESRPERRFCDNSCQMKAYRRRQKEAQRLHAEGKTPGRIAKLLDSDTETVRGWLKPKERN